MASKLIRGIQKTPFAILIYSDAGLGKSSLAAGFPNSVVLGPEKNQELNALKFPVADNYNILINQLNEIESGKHQAENIKTVVLDTVDMMETVMVSEIEKREGKSIAFCAGGFGKAFKEIKMKHVMIQEKLEKIRTKCGMNIIVLAHCVKNKFSDPIMGIDYDTYELPLHKSGKSDFNKIYVDWVSAVMLLEEKSMATEDGRYAIGTGQKVLYTRCKPSYVAKNRYNFPEEILLDHTAEHFKNSNKVLGLINDFYINGGIEIDGGDDLVIIMNECKQLLNDLKNEQIKPAIIKSLNNGSGNKDELLRIKDKILSLLGGK